LIQEEKTAVVQCVLLALLVDQWKEKKKSRSYNDTRTVPIENFSPHSAIDSRSWNFQKEEARSLRLTWKAARQN